MDSNTLMSLMGLAGVHNGLNPNLTGRSTAQLTMAQPDAGTPAVGTIPQMLPQAPAYHPQGTPIVANPWNLNSDTIPMDRNAGQGIPNIAAMQPAKKTGGFSTGNILQALLGSNFGQ
jgi:hypothetical protein